MVTRKVDTLHWGVRRRVQHIVPDQPVHPRQTPKAGATEPACAAR